MVGGGGGEGWRRRVGGGWGGWVRAGGGGLVWWGAEGGGGLEEAGWGDVGWRGGGAIRLTGC